MFRSKAAVIALLTVSATALVQAQPVRVETPSLPATWDWLAGTFWYVGQKDLPAYLYDTRTQSGTTVPDQAKFKGADIGVLVGGGFEIFRVAVEVRYNIGMRNISPDGAVAETKSRGWEIVGKFRIN